MTAQASQDQDDPDWIERIQQTDASDVTSKAEDQLEAWRERIDELEAEAEEVSADMKAELGARLQLVRGTADQLEDRVEELRTRGEDEAKDIKGSIQALVIGLRRDLDDLEDRLRHR